MQYPKQKGEKKGQGSKIYTFMFLIDPKLIPSVWGIENNKTKVAILFC